MKGFHVELKSELKFLNFAFAFARHEEPLRVRLYWDESERDIASRWVHRESNLMFTLDSDKDQILDSESFTWWLVMGASASVKARTRAQRLVP